MPSDDSPVGYKRPPAHSRFQKGRSGNPQGRPKKTPDFFEDASEILGATVTGQAKGKLVTLPVLQVVFRNLCREALKGNNQALRRLIDLMLTLGLEGRNKIEIQENEGRDSLEEIMEMVRRHRGNFDGAPKEPSPSPKEPSPKWEEFEKRADALEKEERQRLLREARLSQHSGFARQ